MAEKVATTCNGCGATIHVPPEAVGVAYCTESCARRHLSR